VIIEYLVRDRVELLLTYNRLHKSIVELHDVFSVAQIVSGCNTVTCYSPISKAI